MKGVMDKLGIPRKYEAEAVDLFLARMGQAPVPPMRSISASPRSSTCSPAKVRRGAGSPGWRRPLQGRCPSTGRSMTYQVLTSGEKEENRMDDFRKEVIKELEKKLGDGYRVFPKDQRKNNEVFLHGICIREGESPIAPVVYVDEFMVPYIIGILTPENVADILLESLSQGTIPLDIAEDVKDFEKIKEMVSIRLVNHAAMPGSWKTDPTGDSLTLPSFITWTWKWPCRDRAAQV